MALTPQEKLNRLLGINTEEEKKKKKQLSVEDMTVLASIAGGLGQGLSGGYMDELSGLLGANVEESRNQADLQKRANPKSFLTGEILGSILGFGKVNKALQGIKGLSKVKKSALEGAVGGGIYASGTSDADNLKERIDNAMLGAGLGAGAGAGLTKLGQRIGQSVDKRTSDGKLAQGISDLRNKIASGRIMKKHTKKGVLDGDAVAPKVMADTLREGDSAFIIKDALKKADIDDTSAFRKFMTEREAGAPARLREGFKELIDEPETGDLINTRVRNLIAKQKEAASDTYDDVLAGIGEVPADQIITPAQLASINKDIKSLMHYAPMRETIKRLDEEVMGSIPQAQVGKYMEDFTAEGITDARALNSFQKHLKGVIDSRVSQYNKPQSLIDLDQKITEFVDKSQTLLQASNAHKTFRGMEKVSKNMKLWLSDKTTYDSFADSMNMRLEGVQAKQKQQILHIARLKTWEEITTKLEQVADGKAPIKFLDDVNLQKKLEYLTDKSPNAIKNYIALIKNEMDMQESRIKFTGASGARDITSFGEKAISGIIPAASYLAAGGMVSSMLGLAAAALGRGAAYLGRREYSKKYQKNIANQTLEAARGAKPPDMPGMQNQLKTMLEASGANVPLPLRRMDALSPYFASETAN